MSLSHTPPLAPGNDASWDDAAFSAYVRHVRADLIQRRDNISYFKSMGYMRSRCLSEWEIWYGATPDAMYYVKLDGGPGTLACDIMCQKADLPRYNCNLEIIGDNVRDTEHTPMPAEPDSDDEDCSQAIAALPLIAVDAEKHFTKKPTYTQEIGYLLQCKGSPRVVELLGRSEDGLLVFPKFARSFVSTVIRNTDKGRIQNIKRWMLDIIDAVAYLHALGIIHRDLTIRNILEAAPLVLCDLECKWATHHPPELRPWDETQFSPASDVFALGCVLWEVCYFNTPHNYHVLHMTPPPPPFFDIFLACTRERPEERPSLVELRAMYEKV